MFQLVVFLLYVLFVIGGTVLAIVFECKSSWVCSSSERMITMLMFALILCIVSFILCFLYVLCNEEYWWFVLMLLPLIAGRIAERMKK